MLDLAIVTFLEHEHRDLELSELGGFVGERIGIFLHGVADEDQGADLKQLSFLLSVGEDLAYLGFPGCADIVLASWVGWEIQREARHSPRPR